MKTMRSLLFAVLLGLLLSGCAPAAQPVITPLAESMKGYELYSWQDGGQWKFSLLVGTNREKTLDEIQSPDTALVGVDALKATLEAVPSGQYITWSAREPLSFPPDEIIQQVEQICEDQGLPLNIAGPASTTGPAASSELPLKGWAVLVRGQYAYFAAGTNIQVVDVSIPAAPTLAGQARARLPGSGMVLSGDQLYSFNSQPRSGSPRSSQVISIIDVSDPLSLNIAGEYELEGLDEAHVQDITVLGDTAYIMVKFRTNTWDFAKGLLILDAGDSSPPKQLALDMTVPASPTDSQVSAVDADTVYISDEGGMRIFHLEDKTQLTGAGSIECKECRLLAIDGGGDTAYFQQAKYDHQQLASIITGYDIRNPATPLRLDTYTVSGAYGYALRNLVLYGTDIDDNLRIYSLAEKGNVTQTGFFDPPGLVRDVFVSGTMAYLAVGYNDMIILDVSNPASPVQVARYNAFGYTFQENPKTIPDSSDTQPPVCESIFDADTWSSAPNALTEWEVPLVATDTQNDVTHMRSSDDGLQWTAWMPYHSPHRIIARVPVSWGSVGIKLQYRDSAGNISETCSWQKSTEGW